MKEQSTVALAVFVGLLLFQQGTSMDPCNSISGIIEATTPEARYEVTITVIEAIAPAILENITSRLDSNTSDSLGIVYTVLAESFGFRVSESGFNEFTNAVDTISIAQDEACRSASTISANDAPRLIQEFQDDLEREEQDLTLLRSLYGQLLCIDSGNIDSPARKRRQSSCPQRQDCTCPDGGLNNGTFSCSCEFFACLEGDEAVLRPILGFSTIESQCLAFVVDTTGSMSEEIDAARNIILNFVRIEEEIGVAGCYVLVPFNDIGPSNEMVHEQSVGPVIVAYTAITANLQDFFAAVRGLTANGGGDTPEYALYAIIQAFEAIRPGNRLVLTRGSQIVVITDAPSKQPELVTEIIQAANERGVCIHFFLSDDPTGDGVYQQIAAGTTGTLIENFENGELSQFVAAYRSNPCLSTMSSTVDNPSPSPVRGKRQVDTPLGEDNTCQTFTVNQFSILLKLTINAPLGTLANLTRPDLSQSVVTSGTGDFAVLSESNPLPGNWQVCTSDGANISISFALTIELDITLVYLNEGRDSTIISPPACTGGRIALLTSQVDNIEQAKLDLVDQLGEVQHRLPLSRCTGALVSEKTYFPLREGLSYHLVGQDSQGRDFDHDTNIDVAFQNQSSYSYELTSTGPSIVDIKPGKVVTLQFSLENLDDFSSRFEFATSAADGIRARVTSVQTEVEAGQSVVINVEVQMASEEFSEGATSHFTLTATNDCSMLSASQILREASSALSDVSLTVFVHLWITVGVLASLAFGNL